MINNLEEQIADNNRLIEENKEHLSNLRADIAKHKEAISGLEQDLAKHNKALLGIHDEFGTTDSQVKEYIELNFRLESELQALRHESAIKALLDEEPCFWDAIQARLRRKIDVLDDGMTNLGSYIEPQEFAEKIKKIHADPKNYSPVFQKLNEAKAIYEDLQREACSRVASHKPVPLESKSSRIRAVDNFLTDPAIASIWNQQ
jgi:chromosome segregation ATPase